MAKAVGLIGSLKGKVGNTVFATRRGIQIARVYQPVVANPKSSRQALSRAKFALATETLRPFALFLRAGLQMVRPTYEFQRGIAGMVPIDAAIITGTTPATLQVDETEMAKVFSAPLLSPFQAGSPSSEVEGRISVEVTIPGSDFLESDGSAIDCGMVFALHAGDVDDVIVVHEKEFTPDTAKTCNLSVPTNWSGLNVKVYAFAKQIPIAENGIPSTDLPWMYPAKTSRCMFVGSVDVA